MDWISGFHCGEVVGHDRSADGTVTITKHRPNSHLAPHAHGLSHSARVLSGGYFERVGNERHLRVPGCEVFYDHGFVHENLFGRVETTCVNSVTSHPLVGRLPTEAMSRAMSLLTSRAHSSLKGLANALGYHPVYLARSFRREFGVSVGQCARTIRLMRCSELIIQSDLSLTEIALECGYYDHAHLSRELATEVGFTPSEVR